MVGPAVRDGARGPVEVLESGMFCWCLGGRNDAGGRVFGLVCPAGIDRKSTRLNSSHWE